MAINDGYIPVILGGDHSASIGSIAGASQKSARLGLIWLDCHPDASRKKLVDLLVVRKANVYTIEKNGLKKLIYQSPWYHNGDYAGFVEISLEIPFEMPHFIRS